VPGRSTNWTLWPDGVCNTCYNAVDRHVIAGRGTQAAIIYDSPVTNTKQTITYAALQTKTETLAGILKHHFGVQKGDRVILYMPMVPEAVIAMLACARIGAVHSVVFGGFSPESLKDRILDCGAKILITADEGLRGGKKIPLKANSDAAADKAGGVTTILVVRPDLPAMTVGDGKLQFAAYEHPTHHGSLIEIQSEHLPPILWARRISLRLCAMFRP
jgi:acyl-coenzyme A synthetase/AMP-(fatty) acid ligase